MASGVAYLHRKGVIHGNLRPSNVLYKSTRSEPHFKVQLSDYGLERLFSRGVGDDWPVPEILNGSAKNADKASDMFLLGCLFLYVFTGLQPFGLDVAQNVKQGSLAVDPSIVGRELQETVRFLLNTNYKLRIKASLLKEQPALKSIFTEENEDYEILNRLV